MASCILYHGPGAREAALEEAHRMGRFFEDPFGDEGLKVDASRAIVLLLQSIPVGTEKGIVLVGPMDRATPEASDVLLKCIEEFAGDYVQPILWAHDMGGVTPTIRSRCLDRWAPKTSEDEEDPLAAVGWELVEASLDGEYWRIPKLVESNGGKETELLQAAVDALQVTMDDEESRILWQRVRKVAVHWNPTPVEVIAAFLP